MEIYPKVSVEICATDRGYILKWDNHRGPEPFAPARNGLEVYEDLDAALRCVGTILESTP